MLHLRLIKLVLRRIRMEFRHMRVRRWRFEILASATTDEIESGTQTDGANDESTDADAYACFGAG
jgi:hypothetical protein